MNDGIVTVHGIEPFHAPRRTFAVSYKDIVFQLKDVVPTCFVVIASICLLYSYNIFLKKQNSSYVTENVIAKEFIH